MNFARSHFGATEGRARCAGAGGHPARFGRLQLHCIALCAHNATLMTMQRVLIDLMTLDIYDMTAGTLADRVAECGEII